MSSSSSALAQSVSSERCWRTLAGLWLLLFCLSPFVAAQEQKPRLEGQNASPAAQPEDAELVRKREEWFYQQRAYPLRYIPAGARLRALKELDEMIKAQKKLGLVLEGPLPNVTGFPGPTTWTVIGPQPIISSLPSGSFPVSGRITALAVDPTNSSIVYAGGAQGGVWKSTDGGVSWTPKTDSQASLATGSIAIDSNSCSPAPCKTIYVGTGEENFSADSYYGAGILKSTDGGDTWTLLGGSVFGGPFGPIGCDGGFHIGAIAVHPTNPLILLLAGDRSGTCPGIYRSTDAGQTWTPVLGGFPGTGVFFDPANPNIAYAALGFSGVYKSTDAGATWTRADAAGTTKLPTTDVGRIALAIAPSNTSTLYASIGSAAGGGISGLGPGLLGFFKSTDGGVNWTQLTGTPDYCNPQCWYNNVVAVHPTDPMTVFVGGLGLLRSSDGGNTWVGASQGASGVGLHVDHHTLSFSNAALGAVKLYIGNDGGAWRSDNPTAAIPGAYDLVNLNATLAITQFYPGQSVHRSDENIGYSGTQDNGTERYSGNLSWLFTTGSDGGWTVVDEQVPSTVFTSCQTNPPFGTHQYCVFRSNFDGDPATFAFLPMTGVDQTDRASFITPFVGDPNNTGRLYFGTFRLYQSTDYGQTWTAIGPDLTQGGIITAMAVAPSNSDVVYLTTSFGVQRTINASAGPGASWSDPTTADLPSRTPTQVAVNPFNPDTAVISFSGFSGFSDTKGHVFLTTNGGASWTDISGTGAGALPNIPVNDVVIDPDVSLASSTFYVGTDIGVFFTSDGGATWSPLGNGLPRVAVFSLKLRTQSRTLRAATHGRSVWLIQLTNVAAPAGPFLTSISPASRIAGNTGSFSLTLDGSHFTVASQVQWEGSSAGIALTSQTANQIIATIPQDKVSQGSLAHIKVFDPSQSPSSSNELLFTVLNPVPALASISPGSAIAGGPALSLTATGSGFACGANGSVVQFDGNNLTPDSCSMTQLVVTVPAALITTSGNKLVQVFSPLPGGGLSGSLLNFAVLTTVVFSPTSVSFGSAALGTTSATTDVQLTNSGTSTLNITSITLTGSDAAQFAMAAPTSGSPACSFGASSINAGSSCFFGVRFAPTSTGAKSAGVSVADDAFGSPQMITLTGGASPAVNLSSTNVAFGSQRVGTTSAVQTVTLTNTGGSTLNIATVALGGTNPGDFAIASGTTCTNGSSVPPTNSCVIKVTFTPTVSGARTGTVTITDDALDSPQSINLSGTGTFPVVALSTTVVNFNNQPMGSTSAAMPVTVNNTGTDTLNITTVALGGANAADFAIATGTTCTNGSAVAANGSCVINVTFTPTVTGARTATLSITDDASSSPQTVTLNGTGTTAVVTLSRTAIDFSTQRVGTTSVVQSVTLTQNGTATLHISTVAIGGTNAGDFAFAAGTTCTNGATVAASGGTCVINLTFSPLATGMRTATVTITDDAGGTPGSTQTITMTGTGTAPVVTLSSTNVAFGNQIILTTSNAQTVTLTNTGTATLNISTVVLGGTNPGDFALASGTSCTNGSSVMPTNTCAINVTFTPATTGGRSAAITITDDASPTTQTINLSGTGVTPPTATLSTNTVAFGSLHFGNTSGVQTVTLTNNGGAALNIATVVLGGTNPGDFALATGTTCTSSSTVAGSGGTCVFKLTFTPTTAGARAATVIITDSASDSPQMIALSGTGIAPVVTFSPNPVPSFGNQRVGSTSAVQTLMLTNTGTDVLHITTVLLTGANPGDFAIATGTTCTNGLAVATNGSCTINVTFTPTTTGARSANVSLTDDAPGSPQTDALTGNGTTPPTASLSATSVAFGNVNVGDNKSASPAIILTNSGTEALTITSFSVTGADASQYSQANTCPTSPATLAGGANCAITPKFQPTSIGAKNNATITITDNAAGTPGMVQGITLSGTGVDFALNVPTGSQTVMAGNSASYTINLTTTGGTTSSTITFTASGLPQATTGAFSPMTIPQDSPSGSTTFTVTTTKGSGIPPLSAPRPPRPFVLLWLLVGLLVLATLLLLSQGFRTRRLALYLPLVSLLLSAAVVVGCGGGGGVGVPGTPPGTYNITINATTGGATRSAQVTLVVQ